MVWWRSGALSTDPSDRILSWYHYWSEIISFYCSSPLWWIQWRCGVMMCMSSGVSLGSLITATNSTHTLLCFHKYGACECVYSISEGKMQPSISASAVPTWSMWSTVAAAAETPMDCDVGLSFWYWPEAGLRPPTGGQLLLLLIDTRWQFVLERGSVFCSLVWRRGTSWLLASKRRGGGGCDREYRTGAARVDFLTDA